MKKDFVPAKVLYIGENDVAQKGFVIGNEYDAYLVEYRKGVRNDIHVRNDFGIIVDNIPINEFKVVSDPGGIFELKEAKITFISPNKKFPKLTYGKQYQAIGCDKYGYFLVKDNSKSCYFYESSLFKIDSDPEDILSHETVYGNLFWDEFNQIVKYNKIKTNRKTGKEEVYVKLITGDSIFTSKMNVVGHCTCSLHPGVLTRNIAKNHECDIKNCCWLKKYEENPFWKDIEKSRAALVQKRETEKRLKKEQKERAVNLVKWAREIADSLSMPIKVTSVKNDPGKKEYVIFYISDVPSNDSYLYTTLADMYGWLVDGSVELRHAKDIYGYYATTRSI